MPVVQPTPIAPNATGLNVRRAASIAAETLLPVVFVRIVTGAMWMAFAAVAVLTGADADLWGNVRFGFDILQSGHLSAPDVYSYTHDKPWVNHEWLGEAIMAAAYQLAGAPGLVIMKAALVCLAFWLIRGALSGAAAFVPELAVGFAIVASLSLTMTMRAQIWTFLALAILMRLLNAPTRRRLVLIPLLFALWANLHGGWVVGLGIVIVWACGEAWYADRISRLEAVGTAAAAALATLATPYGWEMWSFLAATVRMSRPDIVEWLPVWTDPPKLAFWLCTVAAAAVTIAVSRPRPRWHVCAILLALAWSSFRVLRLQPLFAEIAVIALAPFVARSVRWPSRWVPETGARLSRRDALFAAATLVFIGSIAARAAAPHVRCITVLPQARIDATAVEAFKNARRPARVAVPFNWGHYALWHLGPDIRVSMDGRRETLYTDATVRDQAALAAGTAAGLAVLDAQRPEYVWMPAANTALRSALPSHGYRIDVETERSFIAVRGDLPILPAVLRAATGCFPDPSD